MSSIARKLDFLPILTLGFTVFQYVGSLLLLKFPRLYVARLQQPESVSLFQELPPSLVLEYKMLNFTSTFLMSSVLGLFQLTDAMTDTLARTAGFLSIAFAGFSILYSCVIMVNFSAAKTRADGTGDEGDGQGTEGNLGGAVLEQAAPPRSRWTSMLTNASTENYVLWNAFVLLALPAIWTAWSTICFIFAFLVIFWNLNTSVLIAPAEATGLVAKYVPFAAVAIVLAIGAVYLILIIRALRFW